MAKKTKPKGNENSNTKNNNDKRKVVDEDFSTDFKIKKDIIKKALEKVEADLPSVIKDRNSIFDKYAKMAGIDLKGVNDLNGMQTAIELSLEMNGKKEEIPNFIKELEDSEKEIKEFREKTVNFANQSFLKKYEDLIKWKENIEKAIKRKEELIGKKVEIEKAIAENEEIKKAHDEYKAAEKDKEEAKKAVESYKEDMGYVSQELTEIYNQAEENFNAKKDSFDASKEKEVGEIKNIEIEIAQCDCKIGKIDKFEKIAKSFNETKNDFENRFISSKDNLDKAGIKIGNIFKVKDVDTSIVKDKSNKENDKDKDDKSDEKVEPDKKDNPGGNNDPGKNNNPGGNNEPGKNNNLGGSNDPNEGKNLPIKTSKDRLLDIMAAIEAGDNLSNDELINVLKDVDPKSLSKDDKKKLTKDMDTMIAGKKNDLKDINLLEVESVISNMFPDSERPRNLNEFCKNTLDFSKDKNILNNSKKLSKEDSQIISDLVEIYDDYGDSLSEEDKKIFEKNVLEPLKLGVANEFSKDLTQSSLKRFVTNKVEQGKSILKKFSDTSNKENFNKIVNSLSGSETLKRDSKLKNEMRSKVSGKDDKNRTYIRKK